MIKRFTLIRGVCMGMCMLHFTLAAEGQKLISIKKQNMKTTALLKELKKQTGYNVLYSNEFFDDSKTLSVNFQQEKLENILQFITKQNNLNYEIKDRVILLTAISNKDVQRKDPSETSGQQKEISGTVKDNKGQNLQGASVLVKGTSNATGTDVNGNFTISKVDIGAILIVRYVGYKTQEIAISKTTSNLQINLLPEENYLESVVVTALGIKRSEKSLSYNVQKVSGEELNQVRDANLINGLSGKVAGVNINASSGGVGGASKVVIRGTKSISKDNNVLYVIDGIPMNNSKREEGKEFSSTGTSEGIADLNPEDVESMSVLTGAAAAALYGSDAANGAILITTKKGVAGKTSLTLSQNTQFLSPLVMPKFQNRYGTGSGLAENVNDKSWGPALNEATFMGYDPQKDYFQTGIVASEGLTFSTGTEKNQTFASLGAVNSNGMIPNNNYNRYNFSLRNTAKFLEDKLTLDLGASYIKQEDQNMTSQGIYSNPLITAYLFPRGDDWNDIKMYERYDVQRKISTQYWPQGINELSGQNPYWINYRNLFNNDKDRYMFNTNLNYKVLDWLDLSGRVRIDNQTNNYTEKLYATSNTTITEGSSNGFYGITPSANKQIYGDFMANINKSFNNFSLQANVGAILNRNSMTLTKIRGPLLENAIPNKFSTTQINDSKKYEEIDKVLETKSIFASAELGYKGAYYLTVTGRNDWPSQLAGPNSVQSSFFYPSVGGSVVLSEVISMPQAIQYLKLRSSWASVATPFSEFLANPVYEWDMSTQQYKDKTHYPMGDLKPERTNSFEVGLTSRFLNGFNLDISLYKATTFNQTFDPKLSVSSQYSTLYVQTGKVENQGIELVFGYQKTWNDFRWSSNYTFSANRNKIIELVRNFKHPETGALINIDRLDIGGLSQARFILKEGGSMGDLYSLSDLQRDNNGNIYIDQNGDLAINNNAGDIKLGSVFPKSNMAWRNELGYKNFNLSFMFAARLGGIVYSATQSYLDLYGASERSATARDQGGVVLNGADVVNAEKYFTTIGRSSGIPQYYTYSATNVRLQELSVGYDFPKRWFGDKASLSMSLIGRNLWMIYNKAPFDPESTANTGNFYQGIDYFMTPSARNIGFNVRLKF